ncbi:MAG: hypothetical protein J5978_04365 [Spirochaetaceae bacterium]|nr:hypothetical protein [Spirochaetaceae bacterium]
MAKMISDLYYTQLCELQNYTILDKRTEPTFSTPPKKDDFSGNSFSFFVEINKQTDSETWVANFNLQNSTTEKAIKKQYESFYKILMEQKSTLQETLLSLVSPSDTTTPQKQQTSPLNNSISTDFLAGTWFGEKNINKVVLMRSGRGFVIYNNGASMNINIKIEAKNSTNKIIITQQGNQNASFFPELPRNVALLAAKNAKPIQWTLTLTDNNTLTGTKQTLSLTEDNNATPSEIDVIWTRKILTFRD